MIYKNSLKYHLYTDDTHAAVHLFHSHNFCSSYDTLTTTFTDILSWMNLNKQIEVWLVRGVFHKKVSVSFIHVFIHS